jgi:glycosyltransferase involved in cell wall biosynthesis
VWFNEQYWWEPVLVCHAMGVKTGGFMVTYREDEIPLYGSFDFLTCNTRQFHELFSWHEQDYYIPWGTDLSLFRPRKLDAVEPGRVTFFLSGGMNPPRKGADLLIRAFLKVQGPARMVIHSQVPLRNFLPDLEGTIEALKRGGKLQTYEETVSAPGLFHLGDVYVYPSRIDSLGLTVAEGLACGLPVIVPDHPPMNEFLDGSNGRRVRIARYYSRSDGHYWPQCLADEDDLAAQMQAYVDDAARIGEHKRAARAYAEKHLDWKQNGRRLGEIFSSSRRLEGGAKERAMQLARRYERERARLSVKPWLAYHYPKVAKLLKSGYRALAGRGAGQQGR